MKRIGNWFLSGIAVILPIGVTVYAFVWGFNLLDSILKKYVPESFAYLPGIGLVILLLFILLVGMLTKNVFGSKILALIQDRISHIPVIKLIYNPVNKIVSDFSSKSSDSFQKVVMVDFPKANSKSIGFITNNISVNHQNLVSVFVPTVPNPTNGHMILVDKSEVQVLDMTIAEGINMVITMGSVIEEEIHTEAY